MCIFRYPRYLKCKIHLSLLKTIYIRLQLSWKYNFAFALSPLEID
jgi:hypothetical protein